METGDEINAVDFFKKPESEIFQYRRRLQEAIDGYAKPKFVCVYCNQLLRLSGKATERGEVSFFSHLHDSDDCEIKTDRENKLTKEQILALKFSKIRESERHKNLKKNIYDCLTNKTSVTKGVSKVEIEKRIIGNLPYYNWRQPDISFEYKGKKIVLELQLSTTFLSVVIERDIFYRMNGISIIWVFNFSDNQQFVNLSNMMCKDIYYSNKRNAFVFDEEAIRLSNERKELILKAIWFEPKIEDGRIDLNNSIRKEEYISLSDFKFDDDNYKPYYIDADKLFGDNLSYGLRHRELDENAIKSRLKRQLNRNQAILSPIKSNGNLGFANESGEVIIPAIYAEVLPFKDGVAWVKKTYWGAIDTSGQKVVHFQYRTIRRMEYKDYIVAENRSKFFGLLSSEGFVVLPFEYYEIGDFIDGIAKVNAKGWRKGYIDELGNAITENKSRINENIIKGSQFGLWGLENNEGEVILPFEFTEIQDFIDGRANAMYKYKYGVIDHLGKTIIPFDYIEPLEFINNKAIASKDYDKWGVINKDGETIIPFIYDEIGKFEGGVAFAKISGRKDGFIDELGNAITENKSRINENIIKGSQFGLWGLENNEGEVILPFEFSKIQDFIDGRAIAEREYKYGVIDDQGKIVIPIEYDEIVDFTNGIAIVMIWANNREQYYGVVGENGNIIIPIEFSTIDTFIDGVAVIGKNETYGYINDQGKIIIPLEYTDLIKLGNGAIIAKKDGCYGVIDQKGETLFPFLYEYIEEYSDGLAVVSNNYQDWGVVNKAGETIIPFEYNKIGEFIDGKAKARKGHYWGVINQKGKTIIPFKFDSIEELSDGRFKVSKQGINGLIDEFGNILE